MFIFFSFIKVEKKTFNNYKMYTRQMERDDKDRSELIEEKKREGQGYWYKKK